MNLAELALIVFKQSFSILRCDESSNLNSDSVSTIQEAGFTLIELMTVLIIVGSLAGISISQYAAYKKDAFNIAAMSDFRNSLTGIETYFDDNEEYPACIGADCESSIDGVRLTSDVFLSYIAVGDGDSIGVACHAKGDVKYSYPTSVGIIVEIPGDCTDGT